MSYNAMTWALNLQAELKSSEFSVLMRLASHLNEETLLCFPAQATLIIECNMSRSCLNAQIDSLKKKGLVRSEVKPNPYGGRPCSHYELVGALDAKIITRQVEEKPQAAKKSSTPLSTPESAERLNKAIDYYIQSGRRIPRMVSDTGYSDDFKMFWLVYPRKQDPKQAWRVWQKAVKDYPADEIIAGAWRYAKEKEGKDPQYTRHPTTWLNGAGWQSEEQEQEKSAGQRWLERNQDAKRESSGSIDCDQRQLS